MTDDERIQRAVELAQAGKRQAARDLLKDILADDPDNVEALKAYVRVARNPKSARQLIGRILEIAPDDAWALGALETLDSMATESGDEPRETLATSAGPMPTRLIITIVAIVLVLGAIGVLLWKTGLLNGHGQPVATEPPAVVETEETATQEPIEISDTDTPEPTPTATPKPTDKPSPTATTEATPTDEAEAAPTLDLYGGTPTDAPGETPDPGADGTDLGPGLVPSQPGQMVLFGSDVPATFQQNLSQQVSNDLASGGSAARRAQLEEWGRLDGWETGYFDASWCDRMTGIVDVKSYVSVYQTADGAFSNYQYNMSTTSRINAGGISLGDQAHAEHLTAEGQACGASATLMNYIIYFQWRNTYGSVSVSGLADEEATLRSSALSYAQIVVQRVMGWAQ